MVLLYVAIVLVVLMAILGVVMGIVKGIRTMAFYMDNSFRWGGRDG